MAAGPRPAVARAALALQAQAQGRAARDAGAGPVELTRGTCPGSHTGSGSGAPGSTSILATALMAVLAMLFLTGSLEDTWAVVAMPALGAVTFAVAQWVTSTFTAPGDRTR